MHLLGKNALGDNKCMVPWIPICTQTPAKSFGSACWEQPDQKPAANFNHRNKRCIKIKCPCFVGQEEHLPSPNHKMNAILPEIWHKDFQILRKKILKIKIFNFQAPVTPCLTHSWLFHVDYHCKTLWTNPCGTAIPACEIRHSKAVEWCKPWSQNSLFPWALQLTQQHWQHCQAASRQFQHSS